MFERMYWPNSFKDPLEGVSIVPIQFNNEDLPPPDVPRMQMNSPLLMLREMPRTAVTPSIPIK